MFNRNRKVQESFSPIQAQDRPAKVSTHKKVISRLKPKRVLVLAGFIFALTAIGTAAYNIVGNDNESGATNQVRSVLSGDELKTYTSPENKFSILMPGIPIIKNTTKQVGDKTIPIVSYEKLVQDNTKNYSLAIYDYTGIQLDETKALEASLNSALQNTPGAQVVSSKAGKFNDLNAIEATYNLQQKDKTYESHIRYVIKDSKMYAIILINTDQAGFDEYANSLRFN